MKGRKQTHNDVSLTSVREYRDLLKDTTSTEDQIKKRLAYLESFCRNIIDLEFGNPIANE